MDPLATPDAVAAHLRLGSVEDGLTEVCAAVNAAVTRWIDRDRLNDPDVRHGAVMLAARVWRRRNSPAGVEALGELGPVYVSRNDPDLAMLLGLGNYRRLHVG